MKIFSPDSFVQPTRQYVAGIVAGLGLGLMIGVQFADHRIPLAVPIGSLLIMTGAFMAKADQKRQREQKSEAGTLQ